MMAVSRAITGRQVIDMIKDMMMVETLDDVCSVSFKKVGAFSNKFKQNLSLRLALIS